MRRSSSNPMGATYNPCQVKTILNKIAHSERKYLGDFALSPYIGCEFNCYPCTALIDEKLSAEKVNDFFYKILAKTNAPFHLYNQLCNFNKKYLIYFSLTGDPYQKGEEKYKITRSCLEILLKFSMPVHIKTKSDLIIRDLDLLKEIGRKSNCIVSLSIPVISLKLKRIFEPTTPIMKNRVMLFKKLMKNRITYGVIIDPLMPYITEGKELEKIIKFAQTNGASYVHMEGMILENNKKMRFVDFLKKHFPKHVSRYQVLYQRRSKPLVHYFKKVQEQFLEKCQKNKIPSGIPSNSK